MLCLQFFFKYNIPVQVEVFVSINCCEQQLALSVFNIGPSLQIGPIAGVESRGGNTTLGMWALGSGLWGCGHPQQTNRGANVILIMLFGTS